MAQINLDASEMKDFLHHIITNNRSIQERGLIPAATEIIGESGLGKTSIAMQVAKELGLHLQKVNLAQIEDLGDLVGFPIRQFQMQKQVVMAKKNAEGKLVNMRQNVGAPQWVDENATESMAKQGYAFTGEKQMSYCPPEWIADKKGGGILMLDDWNRADLRFIQAVMELVDRQEYISWKLPKDWHIILTANPDNGEYMVQSLDTAQKTRFISTGLKFNEERWAEWAEVAGIDSRCINFVLMTPEVITPEVNPRSFVTFFNAISSFQEYSEKLPMIRMIGDGSIGPEAAQMFVLFINNRLDKLVSPKDMLLAEHDEDVIERLQDSVNTETGDYKGSIASVLATRFINYTVHYSKSHPISPEIINRIQMIIKRDDLFTNDLNYVIGKRILAGNKQKFQKLVFDPKVADILSK